MKRLMIVVFSALAAGSVLAQSSISNPDYRPHCRIVIPAIPQPEFSGTVTNLTTNTVFNLSGWETNVVSFTTASNGLVSVTNLVPQFSAANLITTNSASAVNTNTIPFCDFELFAFDHELDFPLFYMTSLPNQSNAVYAAEMDWN